MTARDSAKALRGMLALARADVDQCARRIERNSRKGTPEALDDMRAELADAQHEVDALRKAIWHLDAEAGSEVRPC